MVDFLSNLDNYLIIALGIAFIIFIHELGHFLVGVYFTVLFGGAPRALSMTPAAAASFSAESRLGGVSLLSGSDGGL